MSTKKTYYYDYECEQAQTKHHVLHFALLLFARLSCALVFTMTTIVSDNYLSAHQGCIRYQETFVQAMATRIQGLHLLHEPYLCIAMIALVVILLSLRMVFL